MINPNELMLGNIVMYRQVEVVITELRTKYAEIAYPSPSIMLDDIFYKNLSPIPLTPEILERCGFVKKGLGYTIRIENRFTTNLMVCKNESKWYLYLNQLDEDDSNDAADIIQVMTNLEHLHTLQNLVMNLSNKPLEIK